MGGPFCTFDASLLYILCLALIVALHSCNCMSPRFPILKQFGGLLEPLKLGGSAVLVSLRQRTAHTM